MRKSLIGIRYEHRPYPFELPDEIKRDHVYMFDTGHVIMCLLKCHLPDALEKPDDYEIGVPVKYVLEKGYQMINGHIVVEAPYDNVFGLEVDESYVEY